MFLPGRKHALDFRRCRSRRSLDQSCAAAGLQLLAIVSTAILLCLPGYILAQEPSASAPQMTAILPASQPNASPLQITLVDAIQRAKRMDPVLRLALTNEKVAAETPIQTRAANLPTVSSNSQYLYTQGNGTPSARYIANNGVHEYIAQIDVHQSLSVANIALYRKSIMEAALSHDKTEIARRGLVVTVVQSYAAVVAAKRKFQTLQQELQVAKNFLKTTQELERGGEVAHADEVKGEIEFDDNEVAVQDAQLALENARVALALMLFPDVNQPYELIDDPAHTLLLPTFEDAEAAARQHDPALDAAYRGVRMATDAVTEAKAEYLPTMSLDYFYGIDANHFATETPSSLRLDPELQGRPIHNLGYSALASLTLPIWNWGATHSKVKSAEGLKQEAVLDRQFAQRKLITDLEQFYEEAKTAQSEMEIRRTAAADAEQSQKLTLLQYRAGEATALEVVSAQNTLTLERNAYADSQIRYATALANLATLTGNL